MKKDECRQGGVQQKEEKREGKGRGRRDLRGGEGETGAVISPLTLHTI